MMTQHKYCDVISAPNNSVVIAPITVIAVAILHVTTCSQDAFKRKPDSLSVYRYQFKRNVTQQT
jgi:hypothetical protein